MQRATGKPRRRIYTCLIGRRWSFSPQSIVGNKLLRNPTDRQTQTWAAAAQTKNTQQCPRDQGTKLTVAQGGQAWVRYDRFISMLNARNVVYQTHFWFLTCLLWSLRTTVTTCSKALCLSNFFFSVRHGRMSIVGKKEICRPWISDKPKGTGRSDNRNVSLTVAPQYQSIPYQCFLGKKICMLWGTLLLSGSISAKILELLRHRTSDHATSPLSQTKHHHSHGSFLALKDSAAHRQSEILIGLPLD